MSKVTVMVGTEKGAFLFRSDSARKDWQVQGPLFKGWKVTASARSAGGRYLVGTASMVYGAALHAGEDFDHWRQIERGPAYPEGGERKLNQIWTLFQAPDRLYAGVDQAGLFASEDDGDSWTPLGGLNDHPSRSRWFPGAGGLCAHAVLVDPKRPERIWCGISAVGVWRSDDGGKSWQLKNRGVRQVIEDKDNKDLGYCVHGLAQDPDRADTIYRQDHSGMYRTRDGGESWERCESGLPSWFGFPIVIDPNTKQLFCYPMESDEYRMPVEGKFRVYRSADGADSWQPLGQGLPTQPSYAGVLRGAMAVDGLSPAGVYFGTTSGDVFASADGGQSWRAMPVTLPRVLSVETYLER